MNTPAPTTQRPYSLRKRVIGGGVVAGVLGLALWLSGLIPGLGPGEGPGEEGTGPESAQSSQRSETSDDDPDNEEVEVGDTDTTELGDGEPPLKVLVTGAEYRIAWSKLNGVPTTLDDYVDATLDEIVELAREISLDEDELRVLIQYDRTAEVGAREDLTQALSGAGLTEYLEVRDPLPVP